MGEYLTLGLAGAQRTFFRIIIMTKITVFCVTIK